MIIKALKTFSDGAISLHEGEIANIPDVKAQLFIAEGYAIEYTGEGGNVEEAINEKIATSNTIVNRGNVWEVDSTKIPKTNDKTTIKVGENLLTENTPITLGNGWSGDVSNGFTLSTSTEPLTINLATQAGERYLIGYKTSSKVDWNTLMVGFSGGEQTGMFTNNTQITYLCPTSNGNPITIQSRANDVSTTITNLTVQKIDPNGTALEVVSQNFSTEQNSNLVGRWNTSIGVNSLAEAKDVGRTVAVGFNALASMLIGNRNVAVGSYALQSLVQGQGNIAIGTDVMQPVTESYNNIAIGHASCGHFGAEDSDNIGIGIRTYLNKENVNTDNIAIGTDAMGGAEESGHTIAIGRQAGFHMQQNCVAIGYKAGYNKCANNNIAIGNNATIGSGSNTSADLEVANSVCLGANAKARKTNSIAIGYGADASKENQTVIGNSSTTETRVFGDLVLKGTDGVARKIVFNQDGTCSWVNPT